MSWSDWKAIEAAQAAADQKDRDRQERRLTVVSPPPPPPEPVTEAPRAVNAPPPVSVAARQPVAVTRPVQPPPARRIDPVAAFRLWLEEIRSAVSGEEDQP